MKFKTDRLEKYEILNIGLLTFILIKTNNLLISFYKLTLTFLK